MYETCTSRTLGTRHTRLPDIGHAPRVGMCGSNRETVPPTLITTVGVMSGRVADRLHSLMRGVEQWVRSLVVSRALKLAPLPLSLRFVFFGP